VAQARRANVLLDAPGFSAVIVASNGSMARMNTHPATFVAFKRWMSTQTEREAMKRRRDALQAHAVQVLMEEYLPQL
jgi:ribosomal protein S5